MKETFDKAEPEQGSDLLPRAEWMTATARASLVNRTHRVVRAKAEEMSLRRKHIRSLVAPMVVSAAMVVILVTAVWTLLAEYELNPTGTVDSSEQFMVLLLWFLPVSGALLGMVWFTRMRKRSEREIAQ
ncbi:hypothetical protein [Edaphobacter flagellatus]|uniref:hypothetical protein n=1 Tax=Edaphobacter flagellatus TaxID=1933044 RepID=UPI0021B3315C|nr:hypothetical protein [Edaphobacter flagellatus]